MLIGDGSVGCPWLIHAVRVVQVFGTATGKRRHWDRRCQSCCSLGRVMILQSARSKHQGLVNRRSAVSAVGDHDGTRCVHENYLCSDDRHSEVFVFVTMAEMMVAVSNGRGTPPSWNPYAVAVY